MLFLVEVLSAARIQDIKSRNKQLYQKQTRDYDENSNLVYVENIDYDAIDQQKYHNLEQKLKRVELKKDIF